MRALNSGRPRLTSIFLRSLLPRSVLLHLLLLLFLALHGARTRSVADDAKIPLTTNLGVDEENGEVELGDTRHENHPDIVVPQEPVQEELLNTDDLSNPKESTREDEEGTLEGTKNSRSQQIDEESSLKTEDKPEDVRDEVLKSTEILTEKRETLQASIDENSEVLRQENEESSVAKKRRRNDVALTGKFVTQNGEEEVHSEDIQQPNDEGIRRFDARVKTDNTGIVTSDVPLQENLGDSNEDNANARKRLIENNEDDKLMIEQSVRNDEKTLGSKDVNEVHPLDSEESSRIFLEEHEDVEDQTERQTEDSNLDESQEKNSEITSDVTQNDLRSLVSLETNEETEEQEQPEEVTEISQSDVAQSNIDREYRYFAKTEGKSRFKSSTVYLNAEDEKLPDDEQESIVEGQIKKLISIRDDVLGATNDPVIDAVKLEETKVLGVRKDTTIDEVAFTHDNRDVREARKNDLTDNSTLKNEERLNREVLKKWSDQATLLQQQIRDPIFLESLQKQEKEILPEIPRFTENELLDVLRIVASTQKSISLNETFSYNLNETSLTYEQRKIVGCAERLVESKQRQTFVTNMLDCIRGLSVLNCMRIFIWPVLVNNLPESVAQNLENLPIEINLIDLFQGNRPVKSSRSADILRPKLLTPESVVYNILKDSLYTNVNHKEHEIDQIDQQESFIDPRNETLRKLLTSGQIRILQMAERFLPHEVRREYSDRMFSCVRRFEYFSCVKYFAWPMVKQYFPALPAFPDYQSWYPTIPLYPEYPILPFPGFSDEVGELPEVIEADGTRMRKPRPETMIVHILRDTLKEQPRIPDVSSTPSFLDRSTDSYVALIPQEQLLAIHMAEQLLPVAYRPEFVQKTIRCIREYNYLTCIKYSTWPTVKQMYPSLPTLPDLSGFIPNFELPQLSDIFSYFPNIPGLFDFSSLFGNPTPAGNVKQPQQVNVFTPIYAKKTSRFSDELETKIMEILTKVRKFPEKTESSTSLIVSENIVILMPITTRQHDILKLAESIVPLPARAPLVTRVLACLQHGYDFVNCTRLVVWPFVGFYVVDLPEFPRPSNGGSNPIEVESSPKNREFENVEPEERIVTDGTNNPNIHIASRTPSLSRENMEKRTSSNMPVITVTGTRFVPIFTEHPESVIYNILRSVQLSSPNLHGETNEFSYTRTQQLIDLFNEQQENIIRITESLLPESVRPDFVDRMINCVRQSNFLVCSRDVLWPTMLEYFPGLPSFPDFGIFSNNPSNVTTSTSSIAQNLTEFNTQTNTSPLSETNVKTGQHGDATVTITDTRFFPIFSDLPESVILNILRAVQISTPNLPSHPTSKRTEKLSTYLTEQQMNIVRVSESLLPITVREAYIDRMIACITRENKFLDCTRDITWPTVAQFFPRLPNFPNFGSFQNLPRNKLQSFLADDKSGNSDILNREENRKTIEKIEEKIEEILTRSLSNQPKLRVTHSYLDENDPGINSRLNDQEIKIIQLIETGVPEVIRGSYVSSMVDCIKSTNFVNCVESVSWPTLKQFVPTLPDFPNFEELVSQFPGSLPDISLPGQTPGILGIGGAPFQELPSIQFPGQFPQLPSGISQFPGIVAQLPGGNFEVPPGISQIPITALPGGIPQLPSGVSQIPGFPQFGSFSQSRATFLQGNTPTTGRDFTASSENLENEKEDEASSTITSSVDQRTSIFEYTTEQSILLKSTSEESTLNVATNMLESTRSSSVRKRRSTVELLNSYYDTEEKGRENHSPSMHELFPNITESEFLQFLVNVTKHKDEQPAGESNSKKYFVDTLNSTIRNSLTADQYEILKIVEDLNEDTSSRGFLGRVIQCVRSLSFIRCIGIFVWPLITNNLTSFVGFPSFPSFLPAIGPFGRSERDETKIEEFFGMTSVEFEKELLRRKESIENTLVEGYKKLTNKEFQAKLGFLTIKGYGNGELGIRFAAGYREARGTKIKDNKNLPSILTIISDIMEEVLDQRPDNEKVKKDKEKRDKKSIDDSTMSDFQFLKDSEEYVDIKRSINDEQIISMFLEKIKSNATNAATNSDSRQPLNFEDAYNAFEVLFGTRLTARFANRLKTIGEEYVRSLRENNREKPTKELKELKEFVPLFSRKDPETRKILPLSSEVTYDLEKESSNEQETKQREKRAKNFMKFLLEKYSEKRTKHTGSAKSIREDPDAVNKIVDTEETKNSFTEMNVRLPHLDEEFVGRKTTGSMVELGKGLKTKMMDLMPGIGLLMSFLIQMTLAHARAAATMAGMLSNMALGSAMFGMVRDALFGSNTNPKIKYVYDNDKTGPGYTWPGYGHDPYYR